MAATLIKKWLTSICLIAFVIPLLSGAVLMPKVNFASSEGKQIVFMLNDPNLEFMSVKIEGRNQNGELETWEKQDNNGFKLAYTKDWWWVADTTIIDFTIQDNKNQVSYTHQCIIDALDQPANTPRVEIVYYKQEGAYKFEGCVGGDSGSASNPVQNMIQPVKDSFKVIENTLSDFDVDIFVNVMYKELNVIGCVSAVGAAISSGGLSYAAATVPITAMCRTTANEVLKLIFKQP